jgi:hypothetical protein
MGKFIAGSRFGIAYFCQALMRTRLLRNFWESSSNLPWHIFVCFYCKFCGTRDPSLRKTVFAGYKHSVKASRGLGKGKTYLMGDCDSKYPLGVQSSTSQSRFLNDKEQRDRAGRVMNEPDSASEEGARGMCVFAEKLFYVDYNLMRRLPITHMLGNFSLQGFTTFFMPSLISQKYGNSQCGNS